MSVLGTPPPTNPILNPSLLHSKNRDECEVVIVEDSDDYHAMEDIISETSDSDGITDSETIHDIKIDPGDSLRECS